MKLTNGYLGVIAVIDAEKMLAKVEVQRPAAPVTTGWLFIETKNGFYQMPAVGDQIVCWMDEDFQTGIVMGAVANTYPYNDADTLGLKFPGIEIKINKQSGETKIKLTGKASLELEELSITGDLKLTGDAKITGDFALTGDASVTGKVDATGIIKSLVDVQSATSKLNTHVHTSAAPGSPTTPPVPGT